MVSAAPLRKHSAVSKSVAADNRISATTRPAAITNCSEFEAQLTDLPSAGTKLRAIPYIDEVAFDRLKKDEFESTLQFEARKSVFWLKNLGDASRIILDVPLPTSGLSYDADSGIMTVKYVVETDVGEGVSRVTFSDRVDSKGDYEAQNGFGVRVNVQSLSSIKYKVEFPQSQMRDDQGLTNSLEWHLPMSVNEARVFKALPHMLLWISLHDPYLIRKSEHMKATIDDPVEVWERTYIFPGDIKCAAFTMASRRVLKRIDVSQ